jgi:hypothetical protein
MNKVIINLTNNKYLNVRKNILSQALWKSQALNIDKNKNY